ncbi:HTH_Tnp_Tc3_2 domain-containing protein [Trichonephila clavipes]|nr:HTH_Tnp_Tc3_2 domain-containing protein [Trichonephila clavipes]
MPWIYSEIMDIFGVSVNRIEFQEYNNRGLETPSIVSEIVPCEWMLRWIVKFKKTNSVENKQISGCSRIFNELEERWIVRQVHINLRASALKMILQCKSRFGKSVNPETLRNILRKHKYQGRVPERKPCK